jgi:hypothetical protein
MQQIKPLEWIVFSAVFALILAGMSLSYSDPDCFVDTYVVEDGLIQNLQVVGLLIGMVICLARVAQLREVRTRLFLTMTFLLAMAFLFGAGEEISWGQRIFHIHSPAFFEAHNAQHETNLHNLVIGHEKVNRLVFAKGLGGLMILYWFVLTPLYKRYPGVAKLADALAIPIPQNHYIIAYVVAIALVEGFVSSSKRGELTELAFTWFFPLQVAFPYNARLFRLESELP